MRLSVAVVAAALWMCFHPTVAMTLEEVLSSFPLATPTNEEAATTSVAELDGMSRLATEDDAAAPPMYPVASVTLSQWTAQTLFER